MPERHTTRRRFIAGASAASAERIYKGIRTPVAHVVGNHDCWTGPGSAGDPLAGKAWTLREFVLESIELTGGGGYVGRLGAEQTAWLRRELATTPRSTHVVLVSHIPIQTALPFTDARRRGERQLVGRRRSRVPRHPAGHRDRRPPTGRRVRDPLLQLSRGR